MAADRAIIRIEPPTEASRRIWEKAIELAWELGEESRWALIGGLMVQLHAIEHEGVSRLTDDIDLLGDSRRRPSMTQRIAELVQRRGGRMKLPPTSNEDLGYQFDVDGRLVEVLGSDGVKASPKTIGKYVTFQVPGGTQALNRSEVVLVSLDGAPAAPVRRPSLLGAILIKARAVAAERKDKLDSDRQDLTLLLSLVDDPRTLATDGQLKKTEKSWLRRAEETLAFSDPAHSYLFSPEALTRAAQALRLLIS